MVSLVYWDGGACGAARIGSPRAFLVPSRPEHQQEPPGGGAQPEQAADELLLAPGAPAQAVDIGRRAAAAARRSLDDIVVVQLVEHRQLAEIGGRRRSGALGGRDEEALRLAAPVLLVRLGHIYAVALEEVGALWER